MAIELAAALVDSLSPGQIEAGLGDCLDLLTRGSRALDRHASLRSALDWSYSLLGEAERSVLHRLAVFAGSFSLEAAAAVCAPRPFDQVRCALLAAVEKSLVSVVTGAEPRYRLIEPVRQFARERLIDSGEGGLAAELHLLTYLRLAEEAEPLLTSGARKPWLERLDAERGNLQAALEWGLSGEAGGSRAEAGARLAAALFWYWNVTSRLAEGMKWTGRAIELHGLSRDSRARVLYAGGELAWLQGKEALGREWLEKSAEYWLELGDHLQLAWCLQALSFLVDLQQGRRLAERSIELFEAAGHEWGRALALLTRGMIEAFRGDRGEGRRIIERAERLLQGLGDAWLRMQALSCLGDISRNEGSFGQARDFYAEALRLAGAGEGQRAGVASLRQNLGFVGLHSGDIEQATAHFREAMRLFALDGDRRGLAEATAGLADCLHSRGESERAARLLGASGKLLEEAGASVWPANLVDLARLGEQLQWRLGEERYADLTRAGSAVATGEILVEAGLISGDSRPERTRAPAQLSPREMQVAGLVARGYTNRAIAESLVITEDTARLHVKHILRRLNFSSRAQIAAWVVNRAAGAAGQEASQASEYPFRGTRR